jgi:hypothetical protein
MSKKQNHQTVKNILDYICEVDDELYDAMIVSGVEYLFNPRGRTGITFLWPALDSNIRSDILKLSLGDMDDKTKASEIVSSIIIPEYIKSVDDFKSISRKIADVSGTIISMDLLNSKPGMVKLDCGDIVADKKFAEFIAENPKINYAVFRLSNGVYNPDRQKAEPSARTTSRQTNKKKAEPTQEQVETAKKPSRARELRIQIAKDIENDYVNDIVSKRGILHLRKPVKSANGKQSANDKTAEIDVPVYRNAYVDAVLSLVNYIMKSKSPQTVADVVYGKILPLISFESIDFYLIFEPYNATGVYVVDDDIIESWYVNRKNYSMLDLMNHIEKCFVKQETNKSTAAPVFYTARNELNDVVDSIRCDILADIQTKGPRKVAVSVNEVYKKYISTNALADMNNILPKQISDNYKASQMKKLIEDELRYRANRWFSELEKDFNIHSFRETVDNIKNYICTDYSASVLKLMNPETLQYAINPNDKLKVILSFINSTYFLYSPMSVKVYETFISEFTISNVPTYSNGIWAPNGRHEIYEYATALAQLEDESYSDKEKYAVKMIKDLSKRGNLSAEGIEKIQKLTTKKPASDK